MTAIKLYQIQATSPEDWPPYSGNITLLATPGNMASSGSFGVSAKSSPSRSKVNKNINFKVVTYDVESAIKMIKAKYPECTITNISLKEKVDEVDPQVVLEIFNSNKSSTSETE